MKNVAVLTENGALALFLSPHPGVFDSSRRSQPPESCNSRQKKKCLCPGPARGGVLGAAELTDAFKAEIPPLAEIRM